MEKKLAQVQAGIVLGLTTRHIRRLIERVEQAGDQGLAHRELDRVLCIKTTRGLRRDGTVAHHGQFFQVRTNVRAIHVQVEEHVDGTIRITHQGRMLGFHAITSRPMKVAEAKTVHRPRYPVTTPRPDHPWRTRLWPTRATHAAAIT
jgi:hypothetical protein